MNFYINQSICIQTLRVGSVANSSVLQIGSAGIIRPSAHLYNTGGFTEPAPQITGKPQSMLEAPAVPLAGSSGTAGVAPITGATGVR
ncbi:spore gernimation protein [Bacillus sp. HNG]|uniref:spore germination protein GerPB n=1 Tax=Bacillaceae TaxID=186817 RepID=UPI000E2F2BED|nr:MULTISPECIES: spore germination protein GerPB [Bacillaceae]MDR4887097.1 spore germination protein GerPB [Fredinandcohnia sp. QZ13]RFB18308.1 spore gernimation protein [Bacillus sp. HNG]